MATPENSIRHWPQEALETGFHMAINAENWRLRNDIFHEIDRRRLHAMSKPEREKELHFRSRFEEREGEPFTDYAIRVFTIAISGSQEEKKAMFESISRFLNEVDQENIPAGTKKRLLFWKGIFGTEE